MREGSMTAEKSKSIVPVRLMFTFEKIGSVMMALFEKSPDCSATALKLAASPFALMTTRPCAVCSNEKSAKRTEERVSFSSSLKRLESAT